MIEAAGITYRVDNRELVSGVSISFAPGRLHMLIGPNGAGKSTLIKILARFLRPSHGQIKYEGFDISHASERDLAVRRAVLSQAVEVAFPLSVREVVMMGRYPHFAGRPSVADQEICNEVMKFFDIEELSDRNYQTLSGGERQRVNFARVLAQVWRPINNSCRFLFLDEPLTFLDIRHQIDFMKKVKTFANTPDVVAIGVVHDLNLASRFADQILLLNKGRLVTAGTSEEVLTDENIRKVFAVNPIFVQTPNSATHLIFD
ncbi:MAG TPA: heme ABC transporter ATP-binding protein [Acidobacteriota bacterium]